MSIGLEAKRDIYNSFDPNEPYDIHLEPPSHDHLPLVEIKQKGKPSVYTMDFYFTNKLPSNIVVRPQGTNNNSPNANQAEAADPAFFAADQAKYASTCGCFTHHKHQCSTLLENIEAAFHSLNICTRDEQKSDGAKGHKAKQSK